MRFCAMVLIRGELLRQYIDEYLTFIWRTLKGEMMVCYFEYHFHRSLLRMCFFSRVCVSTFPTDQNFAR